VYLYNRFFLNQLLFRVNAVFQGIGKYFFRFGPVMNAFPGVFFPCFRGCFAKGVFQAFRRRIKFVFAILFPGFKALYVFQISGSVRTVF
jgi:hypothetical protein